MSKERVAEAVRLRALMPAPVREGPTAPDVKPSPLPLGRPLSEKRLAGPKTPKFKPAGVDLSVIKAWKASLEAGKERQAYSTEFVRRSIVGNLDLWARGAVVPSRRTGGGSVARTVGDSIVAFKHGVGSDEPFVKKLKAELSELKSSVEKQKAGLFSFFGQKGSLEKRFKKFAASAEGAAALTKIAKLASDMYNRQLSPADLTEQARRAEARRLLSSTRDPAITRPTGYAEGARLQLKHQRSRERAISLKGTATDPFTRPVATPKPVQPTRPPLKVLRTLVITTPGRFKTTTKSRSGGRSRKQ